jgi:hypothetical protein
MADRVRGSEAGGLAFNAVEGNAMTHSHPLSLLRGTALAALLAATGAAFAAQPAPVRSQPLPAISDHRDCATDAAQLDRATCRREGAAARAAAARGGLTTPDAAARLNNALARCKVHEGDARTMCERMVKGEGSESGSVASGGVIRELVVVVPGEPAKTTP